MSAQDIKDSLTHAGIQFALTIKGRAEPLYGEIVSPLRCGGSTIRFALWGSGTLTLSAADVRAAVAPDLKHREFRTIRAKQAAEFGSAPTNRVVHDPTIPNRCGDE